MNKKKLTPLVITVAILVSLIVIVASYAYWQLTKKQADTNDLVTACLNFEMNGGARINLEDAWPISDEEGRGLTGYTFTVENKCDDPVNYIIALESLESTKGLEYLNNNYIKLAIDDEIEKRYGSLDTIDNVVLENDTEVIRETKEVTTSTVAGNSINEHTIRIWLSEDAPLTEQNKVFASRVRITGGQGVENTNVPATADSCFEIDENGEILGYDESCGESVVIPSKVNGTPVKTIDSDAFKKESIVSTYYNAYQEESDSLNIDSAIVALVIDDYQKGDTIDWVNLINIFTYAISYTDDATINATAEQMVGERELYYDNATTNNAPELETNQLVIYLSDLNGTLVGMQSTETDISNVVKSLNLSKATYLDTIEASAFSNVPTDVTELSEYENYKTSLTSLTFGNNDRKINLGHNAFARIELDELNVYASYYTGDTDDSAPFGGSTFGSFTVLPSKLKSDLNSIVEFNQSTGVIIAEFPITQGINVTNLVIEEGITTFDENSFADANIGTITLPKSIRLADSKLSSFIDSINLLVLPDNITTIPEKVFMDCHIDRLIIPEGVTTIEKSAFYGANLMYVTLPSTLTYIGDYAFYASSLNSIVVPSKVTYIGTGALNSSTLLNITINRANGDDITFGVDWNNYRGTVTYQP